MQQYGRKSKHINGHDPNDRSYNRRTEELVKRMDPMELDRLMHAADEVDASYERGQPIE